MDNGSGRRDGNGVRNESKHAMELVMVPSDNMMLSFSYKAPIILYYQNESS